MGYRTFIKEQIALGKLPYAEKIQLRGYNAAISNSAETVWTPGATYAQLTTAVALELISDSANDTAAGTGARTVYVRYLNGNYVIVEETLSMNGVTGVALSTTGLAVLDLRIVTAGSGLVNAGNIVVRTVAGTVTKKRISSGAGQVGQSFDFIFTIPAGYSGLLSSVHLTGSGITGTFASYLMLRDSLGVSRSQAGVDVGINNTSITPVNVMLDLQAGLLVPEKTLIELLAIVSTGAGILSATAELLLFDNKNSIVY